MLMKKMTCKQVGGACAIEFFGDTFEEIAAQSKQHGMEMFQKGDVAHIDAMNEMQKFMQTPADFAKWYESKEEEFNQISNV